MKSILLVALTALLAVPLYAQTGTKNDPFPSDREVEASGGQPKDVKFWRLLPSNEQKATGIARFTFRFQTYPAPDSFDIYYGGDHIYSTGGLVTVPYDNTKQTDARVVNLEVTLRQSLLVKVVVNGVKNTEPNTNWRYSIQSRLAALTDANDASEIEEGDTAYITGDNPPLMPKLVANVRFPDPLSKVRWRLVVKYGTQKVKIPANGKFTPKMDANAPWNIYENYVNAKGDDLGFFGGKATLFFKVDNSRIDTLDFTIGGRNPDPADVRAYIDSLVPSSAIAYPTAKAETFGYCGLNSIYNQFYDANSIVAGFTTPPKIGFPIRAAIKGYGVYQLSKLSTVSREQKWNWQASVAEGVRRLTTTTGATIQAASTPPAPTALDLANTLLQDLARTYPNAEALPTVTYLVGETNASLSAQDAATLTAYDGFQGCPTIKIKTANGGSKLRQSCWTYDAALPEGQRWIFHPNKRDFVRKVVEQIEPAQPPPAN